MLVGFDFDVDIDIVVVIVICLCVSPHTLLVLSTFGGAFLLVCHRFLPLPKDHQHLCA